MVYITFGRVPRELIETLWNVNDGSTRTAEFTTKN